MVYLAMTAAELRSDCPKPAKIGYMACHFSPYGTGLCNLPGALPPGSLLILNDRTPVWRHDPQRVRDTIAALIADDSCDGVLLDFQREKCDEAEKIVEEILSFPCPVCVPPAYASGRNCPVFLPPVPLLQTIEEYITPWHDREIWLEAALDGLTVTLTDQGSTTAPLSPGESPNCPHFDQELHCHYRIDLQTDKAVFTLRRTWEDLTSLLAQAKEFGVTTAVGLWQELSPNTFPPGKV